MKVKLGDIIDAIEMTDQYSKYFLDRETGEIVWISDMAMSAKEKEEVNDRLDEHGFYRLPTSFDIQEYSIMEDFVYSLSGSARNHLTSAIEGRGAFGRFKAGIRRFGVEQRWYAYQQNAYRKLAVEWCEENGIEYE